MVNLSREIISSGERFPIEQSLLYRAWKLEEAEIHKLKWIESEKIGYDIGLYRAQWIWISQHRDGWIKAIKASGGFN